MSDELRRKGKRLYHENYIYMYDWTGKIDKIFVFTFNVKHQVVFTSGVILTATTNDIIISLHSIYSRHVKSQYESSG